LKIAVIGWYNHQNIGDERMLQCLKWFFNKHTIHPFDTIHAEKNIDKINSCDYVLLGGGGLLLRGFNKRYGLIDKITRPLGCIGIGVETVHACASEHDMKKAVNLLLEKSNFILVRDKESKELLGNPSKAIVGPDLTFLFSYDLVDPIGQRIVGLNLRDWSWFGGEGGTLYWALLNRLGKNVKSLKKIWPFRKWDERRFVSLLRSIKAEIFPMPFNFEEKSSFLVSDVAVLRRYFDRVPNTFDIGWFKRIRYLVAMRFHAILFSAQCGIPFVCISYQPKCTRFCQSIGMNRFCLDHLSDYDKIVDRLFDLEKNYETIRRTLVRHRQKLSNDINYLMSEILQLMEREVGS